MNRKILVLGSSGMAGHLLCVYLRERGWDVVDVGPRKRVFDSTKLLDLFERKEARALLELERPAVVVNCLGVLVRESEKDHGAASYINAFLPHFLHTLCQSIGARLIHLSTDCVFSGKDGPYHEDDCRDGDSFYDRSKALGEVIAEDALTIRTSIIGPELARDGSGLFAWVMRQEGSAKGYRRALWSGVTTLELSSYIEDVIMDRQSLAGLVQYSVPGGISKFELIRMINEIFRLGLDVEPVDEPVIDKRLVPTLNDAGDAPASYESQLAGLAAWMKDRKTLYGN